VQGLNTDGEAEREMSDYLYVYMCSKGKHSVCLCAALYVSRCVCPQSEAAAAGRELDSKQPAGYLKASGLS